jgi:SEC-C motif
LTLLAALSNNDHAWLIADRRVTLDGVVIDDEHNKLCVLFCDDARMAVAFTGLATYQTFDTSTWIAETLFEAGKTWGDIASLLHAFTNEANRTFARLAWLSPTVTFLFCGHIYMGDSSESRVYVISNADHPSPQPQRFTLTSYAAPGPKVVIAGMTNAVPQAMSEALFSLLRVERITPQSLLHFAVKRMRTVARDGKSAGLIGEQINAAVVPALVNTAVTSTYHSAKGSYSAFGANVVVTNGMIVLGPELHAGHMLSGPDIRKQDPCWCGSGEQFKHCHLKKYGAVYVNAAAFKRPLFCVSSLSVELPRASGSTFTVTSGFS